MSTRTFENSAVAAHISSYPSVAQTVSLIKSFSLVQKAGELSKPYLDTLTAKAKPYTDAALAKASPHLAKADELGDKFLTNVDAKFPAIKTVQPSDVISEVKHKLDSAKTSVNNTASSIKSKYTLTYDPAGKPYLEGFETRIAPINDKFDSVIDSYLPGNAKAPESTSELGRTYSLLIKLAGRVKPTLFTLRDTTVSHVKDVYDHELKKDYPKIDVKVTKVALPTYLAAAISTGVILGKETFSKLYQAFQNSPTASKISSKVDTIAEDSKDHAAEAKSTATDAVKSVSKKTKAKAKETHSAVQAAVY